MIDALLALFSPHTHGISVEKKEEGNEKCRCDCPVTVHFVKVSKNSNSACRNKMICTPPHDPRSILHSALAEKPHNIAIKLRSEASTIIYTK